MVNCRARTAARRWRKRARSRCPAADAGANPAIGKLAGEAQLGGARDVAIFGGRRDGASRGHPLDLELVARSDLARGEPQEGLARGGLKNAGRVGNSAGLIAHRSSDPALANGHGIRGRSQPQDTNGRTPQARTKSSIRLTVAPDLSLGPLPRYRFSTLSLLAHHPVQLVVKRLLHQLGVLLAAVRIDEGIRSALRRVSVFSCSP